MPKKDLIIVQGDPRENNDVILQKGRSYALHSLCYHLQNHPNISEQLSDEKLGIVYASVALSQPGNPFSSFILADESTARETKRRFQENCRSNLYLLFHHLAVGGEAFSSFTGEYLTKIDTSLTLPKDNFPSGFGQEVYSMLIGNSIAPLDRFTTIATAVKNGAQDFYKDLYQKGKDRRFIEYNRILTELRGR